MNSGASSRGALILFEGIDRSGKSTQVQTLVQKLTQHNVPVVEMKFPDRTTEVGSLLDRYLTQRVETPPDLEHLLFVANRFEKRAELMQMLREGKTIVVDRYCHSGAAFTMAKKVEGLDLRWCRNVEAGKLPAPDLLFFLDTPVNEVAERSGFGAEKYEKIAFQKEVYKAYKEIMEEEDCTQIDGQRPVLEIAEELFPIVMGVIDACRNGRVLKHVWTK